MEVLVSFRDVLAKLFGKLEFWEMCAVMLFEEVCKVLGDECSCEESSLMLCCMFEPIGDCWLQLLWPLMYECLEVFVIVWAVCDEGLDVM